MGESEPIGLGSWGQLLVERGWAFIARDSMAQALQAVGPLDDWDAFCASWNALDIDRYMADRGRYRRRRHAVFSCDLGGNCMREPAQPHVQSLQYNPLHGDIERWFTPVDLAIADGPSMRCVISLARNLFAPLRPQVHQWRIEVHQFRIEATPGQAGHPTPEGVHRDGVDFVLVLMIERSNIAAGTTTIHDADRVMQGSFTLIQPLDAAVVDDHRCFHGVTAVTALDPAMSAHRDVLVVTFKDAG